MFHVNHMLRLDERGIQDRLAEWLAAKQLSAASKMTASVSCRSLLRWYQESGCQKPLKDLDVDDISAYMATQTLGGAAHRGRLWALAHLITWAGGDGPRVVALYRAQSRSAALPRAKKAIMQGKLCLSSQEMARIWTWVDSLAASGDPLALRDAIIVGILLDVGLKLPEVRNLRTGHVRHTQDTTVLQVKGRELRLRQPQLQDLLGHWLNVRASAVPGEMLVPILDDRKGQAGHPCSQTTIYLRVRHVLETLAIDSGKYGGQLLRTTSMVQRIKRGEPYQDIAAYFGVSVVAVDRVAQSIAVS